MKKLVLSVCAAATAFVFAAQSLDPTVPASAMAHRLKAIVADSPSMHLMALVVGKSGEGAALVGADAASAKLLRKGSVVAETLDSLKIELKVLSVTAGGVMLAGTDDGEGDEPVVLPGSYSALAIPENAPDGFLAYLESNSTPLGSLMRLVADQTGRNISVSDSVRDKSVSIFLRNVAVEAAVEEICRAAGLWFRAGDGETIRITSMEEYSENLNTFREDKTEIFTLLYPNVIEVASVIYGLYPDRTLLSLGEEEFDEDDEYDLSRRFRRFRVLDDNGGSQFMRMEAPQSSSSGSRSGGGNFSYSRGGATSRLSQWEQLNDRYRRRNQYGQETNYSDAALMEEALASGDTNLIDRVKAKITGRNANIFITLSRKNNILIVRTSDMRVMDEIRAIVKKLDVPTPMVLLELKILELDVDDNYEATFQYFFNRDSHTVGNSGSISASALQAGKDAFDPSFAFGIVNKTLEARINLLQKDGKMRTLATPTLLVANNEVSRIFSGKEYPIVTGWRQNDSTATYGVITQGSRTVEISKEDVGIMLLFTPNINADKSVTIRLLQENSEISPDKVDIPVDGGNGISAPIEYVESRSLAGTFVAKDGMTVMAGGLVKETEGETYWRTPVLGSIPLIGWLFRGTEKVKNRTELIVLIRPHVILTPMEGGKISEELMRVLSAHPAAEADSMLIHKPLAPHNLKDDARNVTGE